MNFTRVSQPKQAAPSLVSTRQSRVPSRASQQSAAAAILQMQKMAGNQAVARMLQRQTATRSSVSSAAPIQRVVVPAAWTDKQAEYRLYNLYTLILQPLVELEDDEELNDQMMDFYTLSTALSDKLAAKPKVDADVKTAIDDLAKSITASEDRLLKLYTEKGKGIDAKTMYRSMSEAEYSKDPIANKVSKMGYNTMGEKWRLWFTNWLPYASAFYNESDNDGENEKRKIYKYTMPDKVNGVISGANPGGPAPHHGKEDAETFNKVAVHQEGMHKGMTSTHKEAEQLIESLDGPKPERMNYGFGQKQLALLNAAIASVEEVGEDELLASKAIYEIHTKRSKKVNELIEKYKDQCPPILKRLKAILD